MTKERVKEDNSFKRSKIRGNFSIWFFFFNFENRRPLNILILREQTEKNRGDQRYFRDVGIILNGGARQEEMRSRIKRTAVLKKAREIGVKCARRRPHRGEVKVEKC